MIQKLYQKENNLFQSLNWLAFQENYGHKIVRFKGFSGLLLEIPMNQKFIWVQKGPQTIDRKKLEQIKKIAKESHACFVRIEPGQIKEQLLLKPVTKKSLLSGQASPKVTSIVDIAGTEEKILAGMKPKTRYNIRLAEKKGVQIKMLDNEDILYDLLKKTAQREKGYAPHLKQYYTKLIKDLAKNDVAHIFVAEYEKEFIATILVSFFGEVATYLHGGFDENYKNLMAPYLCHWEAIKYARQKGCKSYDFWGVAETDDPNDPWAGITKFKEGFGGQKVVFPGAFDIIINPGKYKILTVAAKGKHLFK